MAAFITCRCCRPASTQCASNPAGYQAQELQDLELAVAARLELDYRLRPISDVWESGQYRSVFLPGTQTIVTFYGPDVDTSRSGTFEGQQGKRGTLESAVSAVIDANQIEQLPLDGRDVYTMLVALPDVTADAGTSRGLGDSINGQRPSSSNYLLDGLENNNYLLPAPSPRKRRKWSRNTASRPITIRPNMDERPASWLTP